MSLTDFASSTATGPARSAGSPGNPGTDDVGTRTACTEGDPARWLSRGRLTRSWQVPTLRESTPGRQQRSPRSSRTGSSLPGRDSGGVTLRDRPGSGNPRAEPAVELSMKAPSLSEELP